METFVNRIGSPPAKGGRIVFCAYDDSKHLHGQAIDNVSGVVALLALAERLCDFPIELVLFGGEDNWYPGDSLTLQQGTEGIEAVMGPFCTHLSISRTGWIPPRWPERPGSPVKWSASFMRRHRRTRPFNLTPGVPGI